MNNAGTMTIGDGAMLPLSGIINNTGTIALDSAGNTTALELIQSGITLQGGGQVILSDNDQNFISGAFPGVTLTNVDNTISGAGQLGDWQTMLINQGTIVADRHPCSDHRYRIKRRDQLRNPGGDRDRRLDREQ